MRALRSRFLKALACRSERLPWMTSQATNCIFFFGQNVGSNSPRMVHSLQAARRRNVPIVTFNPLRERGLERVVNPQSPVEMLTNAATQISTQYHQVKAGGDIAA